MSDVIRAMDRTFELAEGPVWDSARDRVLWVDILAGSWFEGSLKEEERLKVISERWVGETVGAVFPTVSGNRLVAGSKSVWLDSGEPLLPPRRVIDDDDRSRINDCGVDPRGRLLVGTVATDGRLGQDRLVRFEEDGGITQLDSDLSCSNGIAWSVDGSSMYSVDSRGHAAFVRPYDSETGVTGPRRRHIDFQSAIPDGACIDSEDHLWVAIWGGGEVRRYDPDGRLAQTIRLPVPLVSSIAFVGTDLAQLVVTTAREGMGASELAEFPDAGSIYLCEPGVLGCPTTPYAI